MDAIPENTCSVSCSHIQGQILSSGVSVGSQRVPLLPGRIKRFHRQMQTWLSPAASLAPGSAGDPRNFPLFCASVESRALIPPSSAAMRRQGQEGNEFTLLSTALSVTLKLHRYEILPGIKHNHVTHLTSGTNCPKYISYFLLLDFPFCFLYFLLAARLEIDSVFSLDKPHMFFFEGVILYSCLLFSCNTVSITFSPLFLP